MTTTDPKLIEPVAWMYDHAKSNQRVLEPINCSVIYKANSGWTETPLYTAAAINEAVQNERAGIVAWLREQADEIAPSETDGSDPLWTVHAFVHGLATAIEAHKESGHDDDN